jgi:hypothetical protein
LSVTNRAEGSEHDLVVVNCDHNTGRFGAVSTDRGQLANWHTGRITRVLGVCRIKGQSAPTAVG